MLKLILRKVIWVTSLRSHSPSSMENMLTADGALEANEEKISKPIRRGNYLSNNYWANVRLPFQVPR
jgi:hypothetical protein